jgi:competence protein ComEC
VRKPKPGVLDDVCRSANILVFTRAVFPVPAACHPTVVLGPADFAKGGAAEIFRDKAGWRIVWSEPIRGRRPWTAPMDGGEGDGGGTRRGEEQGG